MRLLSSGTFLLSNDVRKASELCVVPASDMNLDAEAVENQGRFSKEDIDHMNAYSTVERVYSESVDKTNHKDIYSETTGFQSAPTVVLATVRISQKRS